MRHKMNSDELGAKGEQRFPELCGDDGLVCNKVGRDRTGWDFIVEFPFSSPMAPNFLDRRTQPPECRAQVKTVWSRSGNVKLRLSSAERLAKHPQLACIFVMVVCEDNLEYECIYCIQVIDDVLSHILKSLRQCQAKDTTKVNKTTISFSYRALGKRIPASGEAIKEFIESAWGKNGNVYSQKKVDQISNLGFTGHRYSGRFTLIAENEREVADVMLGLKKGKAKEFEVSETRWGITLPHLNNTEAEVLITPHPQPAQIILRSASLGETVNLKVNVVVPAAPPVTDKSYVKSRMFNDFLEFTIERDESGCSFNMERKEHSILPLSQHISLNKTMRILYSGQGSMMLRNGKRQINFGDFDGAVSEDGADYLAFNQEILKEIDTIVSLAGGDDIQFSVDDVNSQLGAVRFVHDLITEPGNSSTASVKIVPTEEFPDDLPEMEALIIGQIVFHDAAIAFCATGLATISGDAALKTIKIGQMKLRQVSVIDVAPPDLEEFRKDMEAETGLSLVLQVGTTGIRVMQETTEARA